MLARLVPAALMFLAVPAFAQAQGAVGMHFGIAGGASFPEEDAGNAYDTGYHGSFLFNFTAPIVGLRLEGMYSRLEEKTRPQASGHVQLGGATANLVIGPSSFAVRPYFVGGGGFYRVKFSATRTAGDFESTQDKFGWNAGGGIAFGAGPVGTIFIEARYIRIETDPNFVMSGHFIFVPVTVGFVF